MPFSSRTPYLLISQSLPPIASGLAIGGVGGGTPPIVNTASGSPIRFKLTDNRTAGIDVKVFIQDTNQVVVAENSILRIATGRGVNGAANETPLGGPNSWDNLRTAMFDTNADDPALLPFEADFELTWKGVVAGGDGAALADGNHTLCVTARDLDTNTSGVTQDTCVLLLVGNNIPIYTTEAANSDIRPIFGKPRRLHMTLSITPPSPPVNHFQNYPHNYHLARIAPPVYTRSSLAPHMPDPSNKPRIDVLHVEDDDSWAGLVQHWLQARGLTVQRMRSGTEMRRHLSTCSPLPRCLLLDLALGDDDGLTLCDHVKQSPRLQILPVVILTARSILPVDVLKRRALYRVEKGTKTEDELAAVIESILTQQDRDQGVIDAGDLRLDPHERKVFLRGKEIARLAPGPFSALCLLVRSSPIPVADGAFYAAFLSRHAYHTPDHEIAEHHVLRNYVSLLRKELGKTAGDRIVRAEAGYFYIPGG